VNGEEEQRRGKKLRHGDIIKLPEVGTFKIIEMTNGSSDVH
jgi:ribosome-associated protein